MADFEFTEELFAFEDSSDLVVSTDMGVAEDVSSEVIETVLVETVEVGPLAFEVMTDGSADQPLPVLMDEVSAPSAFETVVGESIDLAGLSAPAFLEGSIETAPSDMILASFEPAMVIVDPPTVDTLELPVIILASSDGDAMDGAFMGLDGQADGGAEFALLDLTGLPESTVDTDLLAVLLASSEQPMVIADPDMGAGEFDFSAEMIGQSLQLVSGLMV